MNQVNLEEVLQTLEAALERQTYHKISYFEPYPKQLAFIELGVVKRERLLIAANQVGKSEVGAYEVAYHLTGEYPPDWTGRRFDHPVRGWAAGETSLLTRDVSQKKLCGEPGVDEAFGSGFIPRERFVGQPSMARGVTDAYDTVQVEHRTNGVVDGISILRFKSYEQGRRKFQGETLDFVWCDEEPPMEIYTEILTRTNATGGMVFITFTPLLGMSEVVLQFMGDEAIGHDDRGFINMTIDDAKHIPEAERKKIIASYPAYQREARTKGIPMLGSGRIFPYAEASLSEPTIEEVPAHWFKLWGIDFGIDHPFGAVLTAWDKDFDILHLLHAIRMPDALPLQHAAAMKAMGAQVPVAWPHDGHNRDKGSGEALMKQYKAHGLIMLPEHAQFLDGSNSTEAAVLDMQERITTGRFKVAAHLSEWWEEYRMYHRKDGLIVKVHDDLLSATQKVIMAKRFGRQVALGNKPARRRGPNDNVARDVDFNVF